ncbi:MAG: glycosyltransferase family 2 protein [Collinsella sp.]|nr:glycosyltransferase family 2 protein [Collinsella sp.]
MSIKRLALCRSQGRLFVLLRFAGKDVAGIIECEGSRAFAHATTNGASVPLLVLPVDHGRVLALRPSVAGYERELAVLVLPFLDGSATDVDFASSGQKLGSIRLDSRMAKLESKINYKAKPVLCALIRDAQRGERCGRYEIDAVRYLPADSGAVWRYEVTWAGDSQCTPQLEILDTHMNAIDATVHVFESQVDVPQQNGCRVNKMYLSVEMSEDIRDFVAIATDPAGQIQSGFCAMDGRLYNGMVDDSWNRMKDARADDAAYRRWFEQHRAKPGDLACQRVAAAAFAYRPLVSIVVPCYKTDRVYLRELLDSVLAQSYDNWELLLMDASPEWDAVVNLAAAAHDERVRRIELPGNGGIVVNTKAGIQQAAGDYIAFLDHDDILEPDALFHYVAALNKAAEDERPQVLFCDEDMFQKTGEWGQPVFKTKLNVDLLYSHNCVTHFLMVEKVFIDRIGMSPEDVVGAQDYDLTLRCLAAGARFEHVAHVLYHWRVHPGSTADGSADSKPYAIEAGRLALQRHFDALGVRGTVEESEMPFVYRMRYALPEPAPLVSIVIPTKDHVETLDACVMSIAQKATYANYEIVLVENNSEDQETFAYYETLLERIAAASGGKGTARVEWWPGEFNYSQIINFGVKHAKGDYLLLLNNDTEVISPGFIEEMMGYLQRPDAGVVGAKLYYADHLVQHAGILVGVRGALAHANQDFSAKREGYLARAVRPGNFSAVTGACQMVRREVFEQVGGYNEEFAVGFNDADFCLRVWEAGYRTIFTPYARLYHYEFTSRGREEANEEKMRRWKREQALFMQRWPEFFLTGDPWLGPNLSAESEYFSV